MYEAYDENEIGALDCDEIEGYVPPDSDLVLQCAAEFEKQQNEDVSTEYTCVYKVKKHLCLHYSCFQTENVAQLMKDRMKILDNGYSSSEDEHKLEELVVDARERDKWDCESIISTYSNIYNHPKLISEPKVHYRRTESE